MSASITQPITNGASETATVAEQTPVTQVRASGRNGYEHFAPLFARRAELPAGHPERERLRRELIAGHLSVARHIAQRYAHRGEHRDDLEQVASLGLVLAVDRFDPGRDTDFLSFAVPTINGEVLRHFRDRITMLRVPRRLRNLHSMIHDAVAELAQRHRRAPRPSEIAREIGVDVDVVLEGLASQGAGYTSSLDEPGGDDSDRPASDGPRFASALGQTEPAFDLIEHREDLAPLLDELPERERRILLLRFFGGHTQTEIGAQIGISQMHVSRLLSRTLAQLRRRLDED